VGSLAAVLERFNRKERNLLIRDILGHTQKALLLSQQFRDRVTEKLALTEPIPEHAWWATDYHINWLAGALAILMQGLPPGHAVPNSDLIQGNQEDIDLVIASGDYLILIEAKAYGQWEREQIRSKLARLERLHVFYRALEDQSRRRVRFRLLLFSPRQPKKLKLDCPSWAREDALVSSEIPWLELRLDDATESILEVTRCGRNGDRAADGGFWCYVECGSSKKMHSNKGPAYL
jgi:hypothetical protein